MYMPRCSQPARPFEALSFSKEIVLWGCFAHAKMLCEASLSKAVRRCSLCLNFKELNQSKTDGIVYLLKLLRKSWSTVADLRKLLRTSETFPTLEFLPDLERPISKTELLSYDLIQSQLFKISALPETIVNWSLWNFLAFCKCDQSGLSIKV